MEVPRRGAGIVEPSSTNDGKPGSITIGRLVLSFDRFQCLVDDRRVALTYDEFEILGFLCTHANRIVSYDVLASRLWDLTGRTANRRLNVTMHRIRAKLGDITPYEIRTVRERGYGLVLNG